jgi:hypothetical protein
VRPAPFAGARDQVTDTSLLGPFDGQIVDAATQEPVREAIVVGVWSFDRGDGFIGPYGSETVRVTTDEAGRYRIKSPRISARGSALRLVSFHLIAYRRGYEGYRSDALLSGQPRHDFTVRHNRIELKKWRESDSHADHLMFLAPPPEVAKVARWERAQANLELYKRLGGERAVSLPQFGPPTVDAQEETAQGDQWLDARGLLPPAEVRLRTGDTEAFAIKDLEDLERTAFYHGVHLQATDRGEDWDVAYRVWLDPPDGLDPVVATFEATLPDVPATSEVTAETFVLDDPKVRAVGFIDRERKAAVLLTCGASQCADIDTAIILAKFAHGRLEELTTVPAGTTTPPPADGADGSPASDPATEEETSAPTEIPKRALPPSSPRTPTPPDGESDPEPDPEEEETP